MEQRARAAVVARGVSLTQAQASDLVLSGGSMTVRGQLLFGVTAAALVVVVVATLEQLPSLVASHFNVRGAPDGWLPRPAYAAFIMAIGIVVPLGIIGLITILTRSGVSALNLPARDYWTRPEHTSEAVRRVRGYIWWLACILVGTALAIHWSVLIANGREPPGLRPSELVTVLGGVVLALGIWTAGWYRLLRPRLYSILCGAAITGASLSCGDSNDPEPQVAAVRFEYPEVGGETRGYVVQGEVLQLSAEPLDAGGALVEGVQLTWSSSNSSVLEVSPTGEITGQTLGEAMITVEAGDQEATLPFAVVAPVASIEVLPQQLGLVPGGVAEIQFTLKNAMGQVLDPRLLTLSSTNSAVATAAQQFGRLGITAGTAGTATISIEREGVSAEVAVTVTTVRFATVDASGGRACGLTSGGEAWCWGTNSRGALGYGFGSGTTLEGAGWTPIRVAGGHGFSQISVGNSHTCALTFTESAYCWGNNTTGALGVSSPDSSAVPLAVGAGLSYANISASYAYTCAASTDGAGYCWGNNDSGQLGDGTKETRFGPTTVSGVSSFARISSRFASPFGATTCGRILAGLGGGAYCWGHNVQGQTGNGGPEVEYLTPVAVAGGHSFDEISAGGSHSCGVDQAGDAYCWGAYSEDARTPVLVPGGLTWSSISVMASHSCGVTTSGAAYCWGDNSSGQLGDGTTQSSGNTPVPVSGGLIFKTVSAADGYTCGTTVENLTYCWGEGSSGQLGRNSLETQLTPMPVAGQS